MEQSAARAGRARRSQFVLGFVAGFLPLALEAGDLADPIPAAVFTSVEAVGCLAYCAALLTAVACLLTKRGRSVGLGLCTGLALTTALAVLWVLLAALTAR